MPSQTPSVQRQQLQEQRRKVDFDSYDVTVDELVRRVSTKKIELAPSYQRRFRWDTERQSHLVESLLLGIPIPPLFMATNVDANSGTRWEVVDGLFSAGKIHDAQLAQRYCSPLINDCVAICRTKAVLYATQNSKRCEPLPFQIQHSINHVL